MILNFFYASFFFFQIESYPIPSFTLLSHILSYSLKLLKLLNSHQPYPACPSLPARKTFSSSYPPVDLTVKFAFPKWVLLYQLIELEPHVYYPRPSFPSLLDHTSIPAPSPFALKMPALKILLPRPQTNSLISSRPAFLREAIDSKVSRAALLTYIYPASLSLSFFLLSYCHYLSLIHIYSLSQKATSHSFSGLRLSIQLSGPIFT